MSPSFFFFCAQDTMMSLLPVTGHMGKVVISEAHYDNKILAYPRPMPASSVYLMG